MVQGMFSEGSGMVQGMLRDGSGIGQGTGVLECSGKAPECSGKVPEFSEKVPEFSGKVQRRFSNGSGKVQKLLREVAVMV